jgi:hypothetical protein
VPSKNIQHYTAQVRLRKILAAGFKFPKPEGMRDYLKGPVIGAGNFDPER